MRTAQITAILVLLAGSLCHGEGGERKLVSRVEPEYPELISRMQVHGTVKLKLHVGSDGAVQRVEYISGNPLLGEAATKAAKKWKYETATAESTTVVEITR